MVLRYFLSALINKAQVVEKLSESLPVRGAAKLTARAVLKAQEAGKEAAGRALRSRTVQQIREETAEVPGGLGELGQKVRRIQRSLLEDLKDGTRDMTRSRQIKHKRK
ncbi:protein NCBP2AS2-like isoform X2 [Xyrichtys novacula]|uniref:Protein NCBP2AS2-like isoform X2 n=1 Tax=Xyrichtys novacula TaxID=13765 RepID=A0AAV1GIV3_XYRNO|nr:protein NCBP2AS2-like isoform X2 [Xyrichtys novacula]